MTLYEVIGLAGVFLILVAYFLLQTEHITPRQMSYQLLNILGASGILVSLIDNWNLPAFIIEICWLLISTYGLMKLYYCKRRDSRRCK